MASACACSSICGDDQHRHLLRSPRPASASARKPQDGSPAEDDVEDRSRAGRSVRSTLAGLGQAPGRDHLEARCRAAAAGTTTTMPGSSSTTRTGSAGRVDSHARARRRGGGATSAALGLVDERQRQREGRALRPACSRPSPGRRAAPPACAVSGSPSPVPCTRRCSGLSTWLNSSKMRSWSSAAMPMPVSRDREHDASRPRPDRGAHAHLAALGELERVGDEVAQDLRDLRLVACRARGTSAASSKTRLTDVGRRAAGAACRAGRRTGRRRRTRPAGRRSCPPRPWRGRAGR